MNPFNKLFATIILSSAAALTGCANLDQFALAVEQGHRGRRVIFEGSYCPPPVVVYREPAYCPPPQMVYCPPSRPRHCDSANDRAYWAQVEANARAQYAQSEANYRAAQAQYEANERAAWAQAEANWRAQQAQEEANRRARRGW